jgi:hypothetical protein
VRERDRQTYTVVWVVVTAVLALILVLVGSASWALLLVAVAGVGLVAFLRATHPGGRRKPNLNIFFDDDGVAVPPPAAPPPAPTRPARHTAPPATRPGADVIDLRQRDRVPVPTVDDAVAASAQAAQARPADEVADDLAEHHVRLLRQVQVKLRDYK